MDIDGSTNCDGGMLYGNFIPHTHIFTTPIPVSSFASFGFQARNIYYQSSYWYVDYTDGSHTYVYIPPISDGPMGTLNWENVDILSQLVAGKTVQAVHVIAWNLMMGYIRCTSYTLL
jgi:hypothetical protein